ncbi:helix-turn-helix domain-containing protein [Pectobacterium sp. 1950-15]|uniref:helix-turn-helix domain-containing protein n=1 Tax=Pectobacterium sp. 1950-15 TaxID=3128982 RepID=UPI003019358E
MTKKDTLISRIIERRAELGWSQEQLSKESGVAAAQISRYEAGINEPRANVIAKLAKGLMVPFSWLAYGDTKDMIQEPNPEGETEFTVYLPESLAEIINNESQKRGLKPHEYMREVMIFSMNQEKKK